jgi:hypothetical protein
MQALASATQKGLVCHLPLAFKANFINTNQALAAYSTLASC